MNSRFLISFQAIITEKESLTGKEKKGCSNFIIDVL